MKPHSKAKPNRLAMAIFSAMIVPLPGVALAQSDDSTSATEATTLDRVTVTGSRLPRPSMATPTPVATITAEEIRATGAVNIGDLLNELPQLATTFSLANSSRFIGTVGLGFLDLRGLGTSRTLVLVNGRRHVGGTAGGTEVDTNTIPVEWIERVEVITGGASAIYGADAVAGAINFILKDSFDGFAIRGQTGASSEGGFSRSFGALTAGSEFADNRGSFGVSIEMSRQDRFRYSDREIGRTSYRTIAFPNAGPGEPQRQLLPNAGLYSYTTGGVFTLGSGLANRFVFDPDGSFRQQRFTGPFDTAGNCQDCDYLNLNEVSDLQPGFERASFNTAVNFDLNSNHRLFFEGKYAQTRSNFMSQSAFGAYWIPDDNAYMSQALRDELASRGRAGITVARFDVDAGQRGDDVTRDVARAVIGIEGTFGEKWDYDVSVVYGKTDEKMKFLNNRIIERFFASIDAVRDANGNIVCRSTIDPESINPNTGEVIPYYAREGCVPTSIMGHGAVDPAAAAFFNTTTMARSVLDQAVFTAAIRTPSLFELPAGGVGFVAGVETRKEKSRYDTDPMDSAGLTFNNAMPGEGGDYLVKEAFAEVSVPILSGLPFAHELTFEAAGRYSDYDKYDSTTTWRAGLNWSVIPSLRLRGSVSHAVRVPSIGEAFGLQSQNFFSIADPCAVSRIPNAPDPEVRRQNCAALGIPADWESTAQQTREGLSGGNPNLTPEEGRTYTYGFVFQPEFAPGLGLSVDYWSVELTDAIAAVSGQNVANRCVDAPSGIDNRFCAQLTRNGAAGNAEFGPYEIVFVRALTENVSRYERSGIDYEVAYNFDAFGGNFRTNLIATRMIHDKDFVFQDDPDVFTESVGVLGTTQWRAQAGVNFVRGPWKATWNTRYVKGSLRVTNESYASNPLQTTPIDVGSVAYHDLQFGTDIGDSGLNVYLGVDNLFDKDPPYALFGDGAGSAVYDNIGRYFYLGFNYKFQ